MYSATFFLTVIEVWNSGQKEKYILFNSCISKKICIWIQNELQLRRQVPEEFGGPLEALRFISELACNHWHEVLKLYSPSSLKLYLRAELPFKAKELALKSYKNLDTVKVRTSLAHYLLGLVFSCPQWHRADCLDILYTIAYGSNSSLILGQFLRKRAWSGVQL